MVRYPRSLKCRNGKVVAVRPLRSDDLFPLLEFFGSLPEEDRLHLRVDVTQRDIVERRMNPPARWNVLRLVALAGERIVAEGSIEHRTFGLGSHVGEVRVIVAPDFRRTGLAEFLCRQILAHGIAEDLEKIEVHLMSDQPAVIHFFEELDFKEDGTLKGFVKDTKGKNHDLLIMSLRT
ncbi:MAG: GNAT family N-acetyltransferase [Candidatus Eisenbacteria sp.]|nr:GNAT family N-acetyltransferase [Candidatus Eisenbacteria bacterium]